MIINLFNLTYIKLIKYIKINIKMRKKNVANKNLQCNYIYIYISINSLLTKLI